MALLDIQSQAAAVGVGVKNVQFVPAAENVPRKILIIGTYDPAKAAFVVDNVPVQIFSDADAGDKFGFGSMIHRQAVQTYFGSLGIETWVCPQPEAGGAANASGSVDFAGTAAVMGGVIYFYVAGILVRFVVGYSQTAQEIANALITEVNANNALPAIAAIDGVIDTKVNFTSKSAGPWGNFISLKFNIGAGEELPDGVVAAVTDMTGGAGIPDITDALDGLGTGDDANADFFTDAVHGYGLDTTVLDDISTYVGPGNDFIGLYRKLVGRPFRMLNGDTTPGTAGLSTLISFTDNRKLDRASGIVAVPGSPNHPAEFAARAIGIMARVNNNRAAQSYVGEVMGGFFPGDRADQWTADYGNRDLAVKSGISPTRVQNGFIALQNVVSFYRPDNVPETSNGYRSMRNISIIQNLLSNIRLNFEQEKWLGISIVENVKNVTSLVDREKARDVDAVIDDLVALANLFAAKAWLYTASFTIDGLREPGAVVIRPGTTGFNGTLKIILSGEGNILDLTAEFDISIAALAAVS
jgi:phage tail sheath gpL-like